MNVTDPSTEARRRVLATFEARFGAWPELLVRAPGRVNLIGEHTDYNDGFVLPAAIDRELWIALRPRRDRRVGVHSLDFGPGEFGLGTLAREDEDWIEYVKGVAWVLEEEGRVPGGWEGVLGSAIPVGAGLSSSAALEMAALRAFGEVSGIPWDGKACALLGQRVENHWMKVNSGIMDQLAVGLGRSGHALLIDCRTLDVSPAPLPPGVAVVILDTGTRRGLVDSAYNQRRRQCEAAAAACGVEALRDVGLQEVEAVRGLDPVARKRARHVVTENARTLSAAEALASGDLSTVGRLMLESHASLRDDFEVSTPALDTIVELALREPGCIGARMTGAGFGGCAVALVREPDAEDFAGRVAEAYREALHLEPEVYVCRPAEGVGVTRLSTPDADLEG